MHCVCFYKRWLDISSLLQLVCFSSSCFWGFSRLTIHSSFSLPHTFVYWVYSTFSCCWKFRLFWKLKMVLWQILMNNFVFACIENFCRVLDQPAVQSGFTIFMLLLLCWRTYHFLFLTVFDVRLLKLLFGQRKMESHLLLSFTYYWLGPVSFHAYSYFFGNLLVYIPFLKNLFILCGAGNWIQGLMQMLGRCSTTELNSQPC